MAETKAPKRLSKVAKEFNVATTTIVDYLDDKGHSIDNNPNAKIGGELYDLLLEKFQPDKLNREKTKKVKLPDFSKAEKAEKEKQEEADEVLIKSNMTSKAPPPKTEETKPAEPPQEKQEPKRPERQEFKVLGKIDLNNVGKKKPAAEEKPVEKQEPAAEKPATEQPKAKEEVPKEAPKAEEKPTEVPEKAQEKAAEAPKATEEEQPAAEKPTPEKQPEQPQAKAEEEPVAKPAEEQPVAETPQAKAEEPKEAEQKPAEEKEKAPEKAAEEKPTEAEKPAEAKEEEATQKEQKAEEKAEEPEKKKEEKKGDGMGLTIVGKIDLDKIQPKKKKPVASTSDPSTMRKKRRKRKRITPTNDKGAPQRGRGKGRDTAPKEVDDKQIQEQIKETLSRLSGGGGKKGAKTRLKKKKREIREQREAASAEQQQDNLLQVTEFITANELASLMDVSVTEVITVCMNMGMMVSINQRLDAEAITFIADEFGYDVEFTSVEEDEPELEEPDNEESRVTRPPIVTIMGHVDHGKTSLLDYIRSSNVIAGEAGGITQHIGAYEVTLEDGRQMTFLDTPGHEAFTAMRARGAKVTDVAVIVVAADDSVMPQTKEAISHAQAAGVPIVFAINKVDKETADPNRIKQQLADMNILVEEWGGKYQSQDISAKQGMNIDDLLDKVLLESELLELKADAKKRAVGTIIEASLDRGRGIVATVLVEGGTLKVGDPILAGPNYGRVKALYNERGGRVQAAGPATPVQVLGFDGAPQAGDRFYVPEEESVAKDMANKRKQLIREQGIRAKKHITLDEIGRRLAIGNFKELNVIIKGDVDGSVEATSDSLQKLSTEEIQVNVIHQGVGQISESDVLLASASDAIVIGFQVRPSMSARRLAEQEQIEIRLYSVIYDAIDEVKAAMEGMLAPSVEEKITGSAEVRDVFKITKVGTVAGCMVTEGKIFRNNKVRLIREGVVVYDGQVGALKRFKDDVKEVASGYECGISIENFNDIKNGDVIEGYEQVEVKRKL